LAIYRRFSDSWRWRRVSESGADAVDNAEGQGVGVSVLPACPMDDFVIVFFKDFWLSSLLPNWFRRPFEPLQSGMVSADPEVAPQ